MAIDSVARAMVTSRLATCDTSLTHLLSENFGARAVEPAHARNWREVDAA
jgi:hypothetical protein